MQSRLSISPPEDGTLAELEARAGRDPKRMVSDRRSHMERPHLDAQSQGRGARPPLDSDQRDDFSLRFVIALDVSGRRSQVSVSGQLLDISEAAAYLTDFTGCTSDEGSAPRVR